MSAPCSHVGAQVDGDVGNVNGWSLGSPLVLTSSKQRGEVRQPMEDHIQAFMSMAWKWGRGRVSHITSVLISLARLNHLATLR